MSKINDSLNDVQKPKKANPANSKVLKEVLVLLDEIHKRPEEIIKRRKEQGITSLDDLGKVRAFDQTYQFESGTQLKRLLGLLESAEKRIEEIRRQAGEYDVKIDAGPGTADGLHETLNDLSRKLESKIEKSRLEKLKIEEGIKSRQTKIDGLLKKGLSLFSEGRYEDAFQAFEELAVETDDPPRVKEQIRRIRDSQSQMQDLGQQMGASKPAIDKKLSITEILETTLADLEKKLQSELQKTGFRKTQAEESLEGRQNLVSTLFHKGKTAISEGRFREAFEAWQELAACTENPALVNDPIQKIRRAQSDIENLQEEIAKLEALSQLKPGVPDDLKSVLKGWIHELSSKIKAVSTQKAQTEEAIEDRRNFVNALLQKGTALLSQHRFAEAFDAFSQLAEHTDDPALVKEQIQTIQRFQNDAQELEQEVRRLELLANVKPSAPEIIEDALTGLSGSLQSQLQKAKLQKTQTEEALKTRQSLMDSLLEKGQTLLSEGRFREAFEAWQELAAYTENPALVNDQIQRIQESRADAENLNRELERLKSSLVSKPPLPQEVETLLNRLNQELAAQKEQTEAQILETQEALRSRQELIDRFLYNARAFYEKNEVDQAITQWENAARYVDPGSEFREKIVFIRDAYRNLLNTRNELARELHHLTKGMNPKPLDLKFADSVHRSIRAEVKEINVALRAYLNLQNRNRRFNISKPVITVMLLFLLSFLVFWFYNLNNQTAAQREMSGEYKTITQLSPK